jgi:hypothetical protein
MALLIKTNGTQNPNYEAETLTQMQKAVGGFIEPIYINDKVILVNEEGLIMNLEYNETASEMCGQALVGDVLVLTQKEWNKDEDT